MSEVDHKYTRVGSLIKCGIIPLNIKKALVKYTTLPSLMVGYNLLQHEDGLFSIENSSGRLFDFDNGYSWWPKGEYTRDCTRSMTRIQSYMEDCLPHHVLIMEGEAQQIRRQRYTTP